jgi:hypothetical protein
MRFIILFLSIYVFIKTISYGIYEYTKNSNKFAGILIYLLGILSLTIPNIIQFLKN